MSEVSSQTKQAVTPVIASRKILGDQKQVIIQHGDKQYRLCVTREDKLILTK